MTVREMVTAQHAERYNSVHQLEHIWKIILKM